MKLTVNRLTKLMGVAVTLGGLLLGSCISEPFEMDKSIVTTGKVELPLAVNIPDRGQMQTRSDNTLTEGQMYVLVFDKDDILCDIAVVNSATINQNRVYMAELEASGGDKRTIYVAANVPEIGDVDNSPLEIGATTIEDMVATLTSYEATGGRVKIGGLIPYTESAQPMISAPLVLEDGIHSETVINKTGSAGGEALELLRATVKITVAKGSGVYANPVLSTRFSILGASLGNAPVKGYVLPSSAARPTVSLGYYYNSDGIDPIAAHNMAVGSPLWNETQPIYCYESAADNGTYVIIKARYYDDFGTWHNCYYKIALHKNGVPIALTRNMWYKILINNVLAPGHNSVAEAVASPASNLEIDVIVSDSDTHDIISNGLYYLGVSNSEAWFCGFPTSEVVGVGNDYVTLTTLYFGTAEGQSLPAANLRSLTIPTLGIEDVIITNSESSTTDVGIQNVVAGTTYYLRARLRRISNPIGKITIRFGVLRKDIVVTTFKYANPMEDRYLTILNAAFCEITLNGENNFLRLSTGNTEYPDSYQPSIDVGGSTIYLWTPKYKGSTNRKSEAYITRRDYEGRLKVVMTQELNFEEASIPYNTYYFDRDDNDISTRANCYMLPILTDNSPVKFKLSPKRVDDYWSGAWRGQYAVGSGGIFSGDDLSKTLAQNANWEPVVIWSDFPINPVDICSNFRGISTYKSKDGKGIDVGLYCIHKVGTSLINGGMGGNAVIGVKGNDGSILWSWHLWITDLVSLNGNAITGVSPSNYFSAYDVVDTSTAKQMLDRNLGARSAGDSFDANKNKNTDSYGLHYQWGRKDPFPYSGQYDIGTELMVYNSYGQGLFGASSGNFGKIPRSSGNIASSILNPFSFYRVGPMDWVAEEDIACRKMNRWNYISTDVTGMGPVELYNTKGLSTIFDPCPAGWRVPWGKNWSGINPTMPSNSFFWKVFSGNYGGAMWYPSDTDNSGKGLKPYWIPAAGYRSGGNVSNVIVGPAFYGEYWSGTPASEISGYTLEFKNQYMVPNNASERSNGHNIRCVRK